MRKEVLLAIIIGIILGLGLMLAWERKKKNNIDQSVPALEEADQQSENIISTPSLAQEQKLIILEPEDETISAQEKIAITGETDPLSTVVVIWEEGEDILVADEQGSFKTEIDLSAGPNEIEISAYNQNNQVIKKILTITYSTAKF
ncbi:MAG: hypothetical protein ABIB61_01510 [Candidatus Shapirobacteria bacterium]